MNPQMNVMKFLNENVCPATGCTEPVAVGYATAIAYQVLHGNFQVSDAGILFPSTAPIVDIDEVRSIEIKTDRDVYKNALAVAIPGTNGQKGMAIASAMGLYSSPAMGLNLFSGISEESVRNANEVLRQGKVSIQKVTDAAPTARLDIEVLLAYGNGHPKETYVRLSDKHDHIRTISVNDKVIYEGTDITSASGQGTAFPNTIEEMVAIVKGMNGDERAAVYRGIEMNLAMAKTGLSTEYGLRSGRTLQKLVDEGTLNLDLVTKVRIAAAGAGDARMGGADMPVMSTAGSGNQGITALIPIAITGEHIGANKDRIAEAALLSHLVTKYASLSSGYLSAICGCTIKAGIGAAAGVAYLLGGDNEQIGAAINLMSANLTGVVCDGAKEGCSLKLSTAAGTATESALMAISGVRVPSDNGIVFANGEDTIKGIGRIAHSMVTTDLTIVELMQSKPKQGGQ